MFIPAGKDFIDGATNWGVKMSDVLRAFSLAKAIPRRPFYVSEESEQKTYSGNIGQDGTLSNLKLFTEQGGESVIQDSKGNVYLAAGNIFIFDPSGKQIGTIDVPERPIDLIFGGKDGKTLFILTHSTLYSIRTRF
jgi:sugar lactone lactonase YvrE